MAMIKKAIWFLLMAVSLLLLLSACGSKSQEATSSADSSAGAVSKSQTDNSNASSGDTQEITVVASNFKFEPSEIHVKAGQHVKINFKIKEGMHGFQIPDFNVNLTKAGTAEFTAEKPGTYQFNCSVPCGAGHMNMKGTIIAE